MLEKLKEIIKFCRIYINREYFEYSQRLEKRMQRFMYYPEELIEEVRQKNDIVDVLSAM